MAKVTKKSRGIRKRLAVLYERIKYMFENSTIHGLHFLVKDRSMVYKLNWFSIINMSLLGTFWILITTLESFSGRTMNFNVQTTYLGWNTTFPAVTVCELFNSERVWDTSTDLDDEYLNDFNDFIGDIVFFYGTCYTCKFCDEERNCPKDFVNLTNTFRAKCEDLLDKCIWNNVDINCCENFFPIETEFGICYSVNSLYSENMIDTYISNTKLGLGTFRIYTKEDVQVFVHPPEDVPYINTETDMKYTILSANMISVSFSTLEVVNDPEVRAISIDTRMCRFPDELPDDFHAFKVYSYSSCIIQCRIDAQIQVCNCTHHLMPVPYNYTYCTVEGLRCLTDYYEALATLKIPDSNAPGLECHCLPSCNEPEYSIVDTHLFGHDDENSGVFEVKLNNFPSLRYNRQVVRTSLDLVVAVGNAVGLFFGASILSIVEIFYYLAFRKWN